MLKPLPGEALNVWAVDKMVGNVRKQGATVGNAALSNRRRFPSPWTVEVTPYRSVFFFRARRLTARFLQSGHVEKCKTRTTLECVTLWASQTDEVNAL
jgi:hypothetical protein